MGCALVEICIGETSVLRTSPLLVCKTQNGQWNAMDINVDPVKVSDPCNYNSCWLQSHYY